MGTVDIFLLPTIFQLSVRVWNDAKKRSYFEVRAGRPC